MAGPIQFDPSRVPMGPAGVAGTRGPVGARRSAEETGAASGGSFKDMLLQSLDQVNRLQQEATQGVERLAAGETTSVAEVFSAARKADIAFGLLMEMRNKLLEAYQEIRQMQV